MELRLSMRADQMIAQARKQSDDQSQSRATSPIGSFYATHFPPGGGGQQDPLDLVAKFVQRDNSQRSVHSQRSLLSQSLSLPQLKRLPSKVCILTASLHYKSEHATLTFLLSTVYCLRLILCH